MKIGLTLSSGSAKGWVHAGIIKELEANRIYPEVIAGCSAGALVGAAYADNSLDDLIEWGKKMKQNRRISYFDINIYKGGFFNSDKLFLDIKKMFKSNQIENLEKKLGIVGTDLHTGEEIWFQSGDLFNAMKGSCSIPGIIAPSKNQNRWIIDGAVVNPIPINLCRNMGAEFIIASDVFSKSYNKTTPVIERSKSNSYDITETTEKIKINGEKALIKDITNIIYSKSKEKFSEIKRYIEKRNELDFGAIKIMTSAIEILESRYKNEIKLKQKPNFHIVVRILLHH